MIEFVKLEWKLGTGGQESEVVLYVSEMKEEIQVSRASYEEHGAKGIDILIQTARNMAMYTSVRLIETETFE